MPLVDDFLQERGYTIIHLKLFQANCPVRINYTFAKCTDIKVNAGIRVDWRLRFLCEDIVIPEGIGKKELREEESKRASLLVDLKCT